MNTLEILRREHVAVKEKLLQFEEMTYSPAVNTRDLYDLFKQLCLIWDEHEDKGRKIFKVLHEEGYNVNLENIEFGKGNLKNYRDTIIEIIESGDEDLIKGILKHNCGALIDLLRAHMLAEDNILNSISWDELNPDAIEKIQVLQIIPSDRFFDD